MIWSDPAMPGVVYTRRPSPEQFAQDLADHRDATCPLCREVGSVVDGMCRACLRRPCPDCGEWAECSPCCDGGAS